LTTAVGRLSTLGRKGLVWLGARVEGESGRSMIDCALVSTNLKSGLEQASRQNSIGQGIVMMVDRDTLILIKPDFLDPAFPDTRFYCWHCALLEGVLVSFPELLTRLNIVRIDWPKPRHEVIQLIGEENQSLPVLVFADDASEQAGARYSRGRKFVAGKDDILKALSSRHSIPAPHP